MLDDPNRIVVVILLAGQTDIALDQFTVPHRMQVQCSWRWVLPGHFDRVAAAIIPFRTVEWLVNVAKKVHEKTERIVILAFLVGFISAKRVFGRSFQKHYEVIDRKDDAVTLACGATVVSILRKVTVSFHGYV